MSQGSARSYGQLFLIFKKSDESEDVMLADPENEAPHIRTNRFVTKSICHHAALMANNTDAAAISTLTKQKV